MAAISRNSNPIFWHEMNYYRRAASRTLHRLRFVGYFVLLIMIGAVLSTLREVDYPTREIAIYTIWAVQAATIVRVIVAGATAISREHIGLTWDALVLTGISARQILFGKWRAVLRRVAPWLLLLGTLRLAMIPVFQVALINRFAWLNAYYYSSSSRANFPAVRWVPWASLLAVVMSIVLTLLEIAACTMLGLATSAVTKSNISAAVSALILRFLPVAFFAAFTRYELGATSTYRVFRYAPFAIADSGTSPLSRLAVPFTPLSYLTHLDALSGLAMATIMLLLFLGVSSFVAWRSIRRSGALPEPETVIKGKGFHYPNLR